MGCIEPALADCTHSSLSAAGRIRKERKGKENQRGKEDGFCEKAPNVQVRVVANITQQVEG